MMPQDRSPIRVQISDNFYVDGIAVRISLHHSQTDVLMGRINEHGSLQFEPYDTATLPSPGATFALNNDFARALLEALLRYYNGSEDARTTRADLLHERERVDKLLAVMCETMHDTVVTIVERD